MIGPLFNHYVLQRFNPISIGFDLPTLFVVLINQLIHLVLILLGQLLLKPELSILQLPVFFDVPVTILELLDLVALTD